MRTLVIAFIASGLASAQNLPGGTINGKPILERVFRSAYVCGDLKQAIREQAQEEAMRDLGLTITPADIEAARKTVHQPDPVVESNRVVGHTKLMISALTAVEHGQDPAQVYSSMLQPQGVSQGEWTSYQQQWKDPAKRTRIENRLLITPEAMARGIAAVDLRPLATKRKLDAAVDQILSKGDVTFKIALEHWDASAIVHPDGSVQHGIRGEEKQYLDRQRAAWWAGRERMLTVTLNDPTLAAKCGIGTTK